MSGEVRFQLVLHLRSLLARQHVHLEVVAVIIHCQQVVSSIQLEQVTLNLSPRSSWNLIRDEGFTLLLCLMHTASLTRDYLCLQVLVHSWTENCLSGSVQGTLHSYV